MPRGIVFVKSGVVSAVLWPQVNISPSSLLHIGERVDGSVEQHVHAPELCKIASCTMSISRPLLAVRNIHSFGYCGLQLTACRGMYESQNTKIRTRNHCRG